MLKDSVILVKGRFRGLLRDPLASFAVLLGIATGVAGALAMHAAGMTVVDRSTEVAGAVGDLVALKRHDLTESDYFQLRARWRAGSYPRIAGLTPIVEGFVEFEGRKVRLLGIDPISDFEVSISGIGPQVDSAFVNSPSLVLQSDREIRADHLHGIPIIRARPGSPELLVADLPTAQELLRRPNALDAIWARVPSDAALPWLESLFPGLRTTALNRDRERIQVEGFRVAPLSEWLPARSMSEAIAFNVGVVGLLAMLVSGFLVYQATSVARYKAQLESERLTALGVAPRTTRALFVFDSLLIGVAGTVLGVAAGIVLLTTIPGLDDSPNGMFGDTVAVSKAATLGILVSVLGGVLATRRPGRQQALSWLPCFATGTVFLIAGLQPGSGLPGAYLLLLALCLVHFGAVVPLVVRLLRGISRRTLAGSPVLRLNIRSAAAAVPAMRLNLSTLSLAVATASSIGVMVESFRIDFRSLLESRAGPGLHLHSAAHVDLESLAALAGIERTQAYWRGRGELEGHPVEIFATRIDAEEEARFASPPLAEGEVMISETATSRLGLGVGNELVIRGLGEPMHAVVRHVYSEFGLPTISAVLPLNLLDENRLVRDRIYIDGSSESLALVVDLVASTHPEVWMARGDDIKELAMEIFNRTFSATRAMTLVAICIAALGLFASLFATQAQRMPELRLLHTLGTRRTGLFGLVASQGLLTGIAAVIAGIPLGYAMAYIFCEVVNPRSFGWTVEFRWLPWTMMWFSLSGVAIAGASALLPAWRLSKTARSPLGTGPGATS